MRLVTWNEKDFPDLPHAKVVKDARTGAEKFTGATIIGLQEIGEVADHVAFANAFGRRFGHLFPNERTPILFNNRHFKRMAGGWKRTHDSVAGRTKYMGYGWARFKFRLRPWLKEFYVFNTHMMPPPHDATWRRYWYEHWNEMKADIAAKSRTGLDVWVLGDLNIDELPAPIHPRAVIMAHHKKDYIILVPGLKGNKNARTDVNTYDKEFYTDHRVLELLVSVTRKVIK